MSGDFEEGSGSEAVGVLLGQRKLSPHTLDAIVLAANDAMALGAIAELTRRGIRVPDQIAVVGFDDVDESSLTLPPLTSVRQPLYEQGRDAVRLVLEQLASRRAARARGPAHRAGDTAIVPLPRSTRRSRRLGSPTPRPRAWASKRRSLRAQGARSGSGDNGRRAVASAQPGRTGANELVNAFADQLRTANGDSFVKIYDDLLRRLSAYWTPTSPRATTSSPRCVRGRCGCTAGDPKRRGDARACSTMYG